MQNLKRSLIAVLATFGAGILGMTLAWLVPAQHLTEARGALGAIVGLVTLLLALVLGLLIWTAFGVYTTQRSQAQALGPIIIECDVSLEDYGPEALEGRKQLRAALARSRARFFGDSSRIPPPWTFDETRGTLGGMNRYFDGLRPTNDMQKSHLANARALANKYTQIQMEMARQLINPVPHFLLVIVVCWSVLIFLGNGLVSNLNPVTVGGYLAGALAIASSIFLILELSEPYSGIFRLSSAGIDGLQKALDAALPKT